MRKTFVFVFSFLGIFVIHAAPKPGDFFTQGPSNAKKIALTFDDGPGPQTGQFLDALDRYGVKATFFMLGEQVKNRPAMASLVAKRGHELASHTYSHINYAQRLKTLEKESDTALSKVKEELRADMVKTRNLIKENTSVSVRLCRLPHGIDRPWIKDVARESGLVLVNWTYGADWTSADEETLKKEYVAAIKPGAILLLHDGNRKREKTLAITEAVLIAAKEEGFEVATVGELLGLQP